MQGWAKGLKDRVERTATQLSTQASTAFTPTDEEEQENGVSRPLVTTNSSSVPDGNNTAQGVEGDAKRSAEGMYLGRSVCLMRYVRRAGYEEPRSSANRGVAPLKLAEDCRLPKLRHAER